MYCLNKPIDSSLETDADFVYAGHIPNFGNPPDKQWVCYNEEAKAAQKGTYSQAKWSKNGFEAQPGTELESEITSQSNQAKEADKPIEMIIQCLIILSIIGSLFFVFHKS
jgi:hypothetical protein